MNNVIIQQNSVVEFSILISCYYEEQSIEEFYTRLSDTLKKIGRTYEIIFVNDGSTDMTFKKLKSIFDADPNVTAIIDFFKNAGQSNAKTPGVMLAKGNAMILIDSDLQLAPEELPLLIEKYDEGYDIVTGYRKTRKDSLFRKLPSKIANLIMRKASSSNLRDFGCTFKIYNAQLVRSFKFDPFNPWRPIPVISMAGRIAEVPVNHYPRKYGKSGWTFQKLFAVNMDHMVNLSERPFQIIGVFCLFVSFFFLFRIFLDWFVPFSILPKVTSGLILNIMVSGIIFIVAILCIIGEFAIRSFNKLQKRPAFIIREIIRR